METAKNPEENKFTWDTEGTVFIKLIYFAMTSLTTVGFGDFHPRSDVERLYTAFGLLLGVAVFSLFIGNLLEMFDSYNKFNKIYEDSA